MWLKRVGFNQVSKDCRLIFPSSALRMRAQGLRAGAALFTSDIGFQLPFLCSSSRIVVAPGATLADERTLLRTSMSLEIFLGDCGRRCAFVLPGVGTIVRKKVGEKTFENGADSSTRKSVINR